VQIRLGRLLEPVDLEHVVADAGEPAAAFRVHPEATRNRHGRADSRPERVGAVCAGRGRRRCPARRGERELPFGEDREPIERLEADPEKEPRRHRRDVVHRPDVAERSEPRFDENPVIPGRWRRGVEPVGECRFGNGEPALRLQPGFDLFPGERARFVRFRRCCSSGEDHRERCHPGETPHDERDYTSQSSRRFFFAFAPLASTGTPGGGGASFSRRAAGWPLRSTPVGRSGWAGAAARAGGAGRSRGSGRSDTVARGASFATNGLWADVGTARKLGTALARRCACGEPSAGSPSVRTRPRTRAPGAMPMRGAERSPTTRAPRSRSTPSLPRRSPCTVPATEISAPVTFPRTAASSPTVTSPSTFTSPSTRPWISRSPWPRTFPRTTVPRPITEDAAIDLTSPCRRCP